MMVHVLGLSVLKIYQERARKNINNKFKKNQTKYIPKIVIHNRMVQNTENLKLAPHPQ